MIKIRIVDIHPPPNFQAAAPAKIVLRGPCIPLFLPQLLTHVHDIQTLVCSNKE